MSNQIENITNPSPLSRSNLTAHDPRPQGKVNNYGHGITPTLTWNLFNRSFPRYTQKVGKFATFFWAPRKIVGQGVKNIQWGVKETETYLEYKVGDLIQIKIKDRNKVYESIVPSSNQIKIQVSMDIPPHWHVDKFIDAGEYIQFMNLYEEHIAEAMAKTSYELFRFFFISSAFGACLPSHEYDKLLLRTLSLPANTLPLAKAILDGERFTEGVGTYSPLTKYMLNHKDHFKMMSDEMNKKISNIYVFDAYDVIHTPDGYKFNPYKPWNPVNRENTGAHMNGIKRLANCLVSNPSNIEGISMPSGTSLPTGQGRRLSRAQSLRAMSLVLADIALRTNEPSHLWWQGNCGNITGKTNEASWNSSTWPMETDRYPRSKGTNIMDKSMDKRPFLQVECSKENRILVMSTADYNDMISGAYEGYYIQGELCKLNWDRTASLFSDIITIPDMPCGHAIILDKRMICCIPHLDASGTDTITQRLVTVRTIHKWLIFGLFDQYVGVRVQFVGFTGAAIDMNNIFFLNKDVQVFSNPTLA